MTVTSVSKRVWINQNKLLFFPLLAFIIPLIVRMIPEVLMGSYIIGFDTMAYFIPNTILWLQYGVDPAYMLSVAPLLYTILMGITATGASIVFTLKILGPVLLGFLGLGVYFYSHKALSWPHRKSLIVALLATLYFVALRVSWDMFRSELALIFLFPALILLHNGRYSPRTGLLLSAMMLLVVLSHQLVSVIMLGIVIATILSLAVKKNISDMAKLIAYTFPSILLLIIIIYVNYSVYSPDYSAGLEVLTSHPDLVANVLGFLAFCYLPLLPFLIFGIKRFKRFFHLNIWIVWVFAPVLLVLIIPTTYFVGGVLPYRWILLLCIPLAFYAVEGISAIRWNWYKILVGSFLVILSMGFVISPNSEALTYFGNYPSYVPKSMLQNTVQLSDCEDTVNALTWAKNTMPSGGVLLVHEAFHGWAVLIIDYDRLVHYYFATPAEAIDNLPNPISPNSVYLIWWVNGTGWYGQQTVSDSFRETYRSGNIAIYSYLDIK